MNGCTKGAAWLSILAGLIFILAIALAELDDMQVSSVAAADFYDDYEIYGIFAGAIALIAGFVGMAQYGGYLGMFDWDTVWPLFTVLMHYLGYIGVAIVVVVLLAIPQIEYKMDPEGYSSWSLHPWPSSATTSTGTTWTSLATSSRCSLSIPI